VTNTPCNWYGVSCENGHVTSIDLHGNLLSGSIPSELGRLSRLTVLRLYKNSLSGSIPSELGNLSRLTVLSLYSNSLSGSIPSKLRNLSRLRILDLENNSLSGEIPRELGNLSNLTILWLFSNQLCGKIPSELKALGNLSRLGLQNNNLINSKTAYDADFLNWLNGLDSNWTNQISPSDCSSLPITVTSTGKPQCFWMENYSGKFKWVPTDTIYHRMLTKQECFELDSCDGGLGRPGGGCYKWATSPEAPGIKWQQITYDDDASDCSTVSEIPRIECEALVALYNSTDGANWSNNTGWNVTNTPCNWYGVSCENGHVTSIDLHGNLLSGSIPSELGRLSRLTVLRLYKNSLSGSIPSELGNLSRLTVLYLSENRLSGSIPRELGNLSNLTYLGLSENSLSGSIPSELGNLSRLTVLSLYSNSLSGSIPSKLRNLSRLTELWLDVEAGPIRNDDHAKQVCPGVCEKSGGWNEYWTTTVWGKMSVCGCNQSVSDGKPQCFWMENYSGKFKWVPADRMLTKQECLELDSCYGGLGRPGGGCYKWATSPEAPGIKWQQITLVGCFKDQGEFWGTKGRDLDGLMWSDAQMTTEKCLQHCESRGYAYAGTQYGSECFCGNNYGKYGTASNCNMPCKGNANQTCGGDWANSVYLAGQAQADIDPN
jgi:Leucine-rich repeat (LRR) protein